MTAPVVVAVRGDETDAAVAGWAAREAGARQTTLVVTAVAPVARDGADVQPATAAAALAAAAATVSEQQPDLHVRVDRAAATAGLSHLIALSRTADLLVVGVGAGGTDHATVLGPVEDRLAVHAECPVVALDAQAAARTEVHHQVVAGWSRGQSGRHALRVAGDEAAGRHSRLTVVAVPLPEDPGVEQLLGRPDHESALVAAVAEVEQQHPGLVIDLLHRPGRATAELVRAVEQADLLVIGCHHSEQRWTNRPGPVAARLMRSAPCPVMLVGASARSRHDPATRTRSVP